MQISKSFKIQAAVFALTFIVGFTLLITNKSYSFTEVLGVNSEERIIDIAYDDNYVESLETGKITLTANETQETFTIPFSEIGISIEKVPSVLERTVQRSAMVSVKIDLAKYNSALERYRQLTDKEPTANEASINGESLIYEVGKTGLKLVTEKAEEKIVSALLHHDFEITFETELLPAIETFKYSDVKNHFDKIKSSEYWFSFNEAMIKVNSSDIVTTLKFENGKIRGDKNKLITLIEKSTEPYIIRSDVPEIQKTLKDTIALPSKTAYAIMQDIENKDIQGTNLYNVESRKVAGTDGTYADKYIEVDLSQQKLYGWNNGKIEKEYIVSSGRNNWTPTGEFEILNKAENTFSQKFQKWMPYWMAYTYIPQFNSMAGFHELTYWKDANGNFVYDSEDSLGMPLSGGCVRLGRGEAKELYEWTDVGDKVLIHE